MSKVILIDPAEDDRWDKFVENHPFGWVCHLSGWKKVLENSFKHMKGYYCAICENNTIKAALPLFEIKSWLTGNRLVSIPFATLSEPLISNKNEMDELIEESTNLSKRLGTSYIEIRTLASSLYLQDERLGENRSYKHHYIILDNEPEQLKKRFHRSCIKQKIDKAINNNLELKVGKSEIELKAFYNLYLKTRKRLGLPPQPYCFLKNIWDIFASKNIVTLLLAQYENRPIAGLLVFKFKNRLSAEYAVSDKKFLSLNPNHYLFWEAIKLAFKEGYKIFDFGRTSQFNKSLMDFKRRWGTQILDFTYYYYPREFSLKNNYREKSLGYILLKKICMITPKFILPYIGNFTYQHLS